MNRAERRQQEKKGKKGQIEVRGSGPKPLNPRDGGRRPERGLARRISQQKGRGS
jgi:hypothetical protein